MGSFLTQALQQVDEEMSMETEDHLIELINGDNQEIMDVSMECDALETEIEQQMTVYHGLMKARVSLESNQSDPQADYFFMEAHQILGDEEFSLESMGVDNVLTLESRLWDKIKGGIEKLADRIKYGTTMLFDTIKSKERSLKNVSRSIKSVRNDEHEGKVVSVSRYVKRILNVKGDGEGDVVNSTFQASADTLLKFSAEYEKMIDHLGEISQKFSKEFYSIAEEEEADYTDLVESFMDDIEKSIDKFNDDVKRYTDKGLSGDYLLHVAHKKPFGTYGSIPKVELIRPEDRDSLGSMKFTVPKTRDLSKSLDSAQGLLDSVANRREYSIEANKRTQKMLGTMRSAKTMGTPSWGLFFTQMILGPYIALIVYLIRLKTESNRRNVSMTNLAQTGDMAFQSVRTMNQIRRQGLMLYVHQNNMATSMINYASAVAKFYDKNPPKDIEPVNI